MIETPTKRPKAPPALKRDGNAWTAFEKNILTDAAPSLLEKARQIAVAVHEGQTDQVGDPYIDHVRAVVALTAQLVQFQKLSPNDQNLALQAAWLHDTLEDTVLEVQDLRAAGFEERVLSTILALTNLPEETRDDYYKRILHSGALALCVKLGDLSHNTLPERRENLPGSPSNPLPPAEAGHPEKDRWTKLGEKYHAAFTALGCPVPEHLRQFGTTG